MLNPGLSKATGWSTTFLLSALFMANGYWIARTFIGHSEPVKVMEARAEPMDIVEGSDILHVLFLSVRSRLCEVETDRFILKEGSREIISRERVLGIALPMTAKPVEVLAPISIPKLSPGLYIFRGFVFSNCGYNDFHAIQQPDVLFRVVPKP